MVIMEETMDKIDNFSKEYHFLSNFYPTKIFYQELEYDSSEAAFQAMKCKNISDRKKFVGLNPSEAKRLGRKILLREDWNNVKDRIMYEICTIKFVNQQLKRKLLATGNAYLEEGNSWNDTYWGTTNGIGKNVLGKILMRIREEIKQHEQL